MIRGLLVVWLLSTAGQAAAIETEAEITRELDFKVFIDNREVGRHQFKLLE